ncbi:hypothetical protein TD95_004191 [Thielaviopsis punctulata]|uniref:Pro-apoptotic serine protease NMA111 n=1 Tax=Thielaviopsis punctulata TaxID=72032 RepID=A0A0F4ZKQ2_9PEZI|nr:hypothetical protein TD95_004191 [Thielaviopsis punctulata]
MSSRPKRKAPPSPADSRALKHQRPTTTNSTTSSATPVTQSSTMDMAPLTNGATVRMPLHSYSAAEDHLASDDDEVLDDAASSLTSEDADGEEGESVGMLGEYMGLGATESIEWQQTIGNVVPTVVSIRFCLPCSFDSDFADTSEATGFVVDAERGYILTNRHVVGAGPFWGYCVFDNHEEVDAYAVYRDPIHDFGILRFDPKAIKYMPVRALQLRPDLAKVGLEIRVVGNDAGEKLCILSGVISRVDRNAPEYADGYSDFNTCYFQTNAAATGGSSGSPVVNIDGHAIALQAGGRVDGASTDYLLPLDRAARALKCIQEGKPVERGDIQCQFLLKPFDECRRLGLSASREAEVRKAFPQANSMLVAEIVLPEGPSHKKIEEGDVLLLVNDEIVCDFIRLDEILDASVGKTIKVLLQRVGEEIEVEIKVGDLHRISPDRFLTVSGATFHNLSYHQARLYAVPCRGVYVCEAANSFRLKTAESGLVLESVDHRPTPNLDVFADVMQTIPDRSRVVVTYRNLRDLHTLHTTIVTVDRHWTKKMELAVRNDKTGLWDFSEVGKALPPVEPVPRKAAFIQLHHTSYPAVAELVRSFVQVSTIIPMKLDAFPKNRRWAMGVVIDAEKGLVVVSRAIVPYDLCDITVTIAESVQLVGKVVFLHPLQNYVVVQYDPKLVDAPVKSARLSEQGLVQGQATYFIGINRQGRLVHTATSVTEVTAVAIPPNSVAPRYRAVNVDAITIDSSLGGQCGSGVLVGNDGAVQALWLTYLGEQSSCSRHDEEYHLGLATPTLLPIVRDLQAGKQPNLRMLSAEFTAIQMSQARIMGASEEWIERVSEANQMHHQLFMVNKCWLAQNANLTETEALQEGDILLTLNDKLITRVAELDVMYSHDVLLARVIRQRKEMELQLKTTRTDDVETDRALWFCGAIIHRPHHAVRQQISRLPSDVYVSARSRGSPAYQYGLAPTNFITHVNRRETKTLDVFLDAVREIPNNTYFVLKAVTFDGVPWVVTMKKNDHYFPTVEWVKDASDPCGWKRTVCKAKGDDTAAVTEAPVSAETDGADVE